ncbi:hypothetical protein Slin15195_G129940 [Septoria linicola]|uniref:Uncharacterized protein n=1 Tax=Septoria linicola TaxID=215465 RepID=A0A9Q9B2Y7_9PEZI|nr:hypothetical protein Slin14017_G128960 [Septoria linicola]USW59675.1 hypothetical protein Slin15195_G129940 [Septoria linicola]
MAHTRRRTDTSAARQPHSLGRSSALDRPDTPHAGTSATARLDTVDDRAALLPLQNSLLDNFTTRVALLDNSSRSKLDIRVQRQLDDVKNIKVSRYVNRLRSEDSFGLSLLAVWAIFGEDGEWPGARILGGLCDVSSGERSFEQAFQRLQTARHARRQTLQLRLLHQKRATPRSKVHKWTVTDIHDAIETWSADDPAHRDKALLTNLREQKKSLPHDSTPASASKDPTRTLTIPE